MPIYHRLGKIPPKRHTQFRKPDGSLHHEEVFGTIGFDGTSSLLYHLYPPTQVKEVNQSIDVSPQVGESFNLKSRCFRGFDIPTEKDYLQSRISVLFNQDVRIELADVHAKQDLSYFYKNVDEDELLFVHHGKGVLATQMGDIYFEPGDYLMIPRGMIYQIKFETQVNKLFIVCSSHPIYTPKKYRNWFGQLGEHSPFCERDFKLPIFRSAIDQQGEFVIKIRKEGRLYEVVYASHPFDVVGWDGFNYSYGFSIHNFEPITGRVHQPPPVHQNFETSAFVVCSFCPRLYDYHPQAIPAPYNHSNIDSDEVLYYVDGDFMSRNHIEQGFITLHPSGIPHGPHPGAYERSIGKKETLELAVMVDTFRPLKITKQALALDDQTYYKSWIL